MCFLKVLKLKDYLYFITGTCSKGRVSISDLYSRKNINKKRLGYPALNQGFGKGKWKDFSRTLYLRYNTPKLYMNR